MSLLKRNRRPSKVKSECYTVQDLPSLRRKRTLAFNRLTKAFDIGTEATTDESQHDLFFSYYDEIKNIAASFEDAHLCILDILNSDDDDDDDKNSDIRERFDELYFKINSIHRRLRGESKPTHSSSGNNNGGSLHVKLPKLNLSTFSGNIKQWPEFIDTFKALIHDSSALSDSERFHYLVSCLRGDALALIRSFPITSEHYKLAYDALVNRYQNKRELAFTCWRDILNINLKLNNVNDFRRTLDFIEENLNILKNLKLPVGHWDFVLSYHLLSKLDNKTRREFEEKHSDVEFPKYSQLKVFLHARCEALVRDNHFSELNKPNTTREVSKSLPPHNSSQRYNTTHSLLSTQDSCSPAKPEETNNNITLVLSGEPASKGEISNIRTQPLKCSFCGDSHSILHCKTFVDKPIDQRLAIVTQRGWCFNCLKPSHQLKDCSSIFSCQKCRRKHHTLLHSDAQTNSESASSSNSVSLVAKNTANSPFTQVGTTVLLATAIVQIKDSLGRFQSFRALFDTGSQNNFITEQAVQQLNVQPSSAQIFVSGLGDTTSSINSLVHCDIGSDDHVLFGLDLYVIPKICGDQPIAKLNTSHWTQIKNLNLADPGFDIPGPIDVLLNADIFAQSLLEERIKASSCQPPAFNSVFGWLLLGKVPLSSTSLVEIQSITDNDNLISLVQRFWEIDTVPQASPLTPDEVRCEQHFISTHSRDETGRYIVELPFQGSCEPIFQGSRDIAIRRFHAIERRLSRDPELRGQYEEFMSDYLTSGHMSPVPPKELGLGKYYIPHHCILRPDSATTKLRVVFDASAKDANSKSLNNTLLVGPKLHSNIVKILLHFRKHAVVFMADVRQMYRQILLKNEHRDYQRIIWRATPNEPLQEFRLNTVTYGVASAPYLACRTVLQLAQDEGNLHPVAKQILLSDIYVDDVVSGRDNIDDAKEAKSQLIALFKLGHLELRKWASNKPEILSDLPSEHCLVDPIGFDECEPSTVKVLGLKWDPLTDTFFFDVKPSDRPCTKRSILSELARIFDPLGFLSPLTIQAKCLIQKLWILGVMWDEGPPNEVISAWNDYTQQLPILKSLKISRRITIDNVNSYELHGFCDSSEKAYGAVIYLRVINKDDIIQTFLICSKARVAPLKKISLPRLELCAAVLLADLLHFVKDTYTNRFLIDKIYLWSDSTVVLSWLRSHSSRWTTFVANRVSHIHDLAPTDVWHHVLSGDNPADFCSRGQLPTDLLHNSLWWAGPVWLSQPADQWPVTSVASDDDEQIYTEERRKVLLITDQKVIDSPLTMIDNLLHRFSSLEKIICIVAYINRFVHNVRNPNLRNKNSFLSNKERYTALIVLIQHIQNISFSDIISRLKLNQKLPKSIRKLSPFLDEKNILRVGGRLSRSGLEYDHKHPALLPGKNILTTKIIESFHRNHCHTGINTTHYLIVQQFWIISAKRIIRQCLSKCIKCFKKHPQSLQPPMSDLPSYRVSQVKPFSIVGVDFGGPFRIKLGPHRGAKIDKAYLCLFVCLAVKAVHLEVVSSLSTEGFIAALRRFVARRGRCNVIHADCGTNFIGASNQLANFMKDASHAERIEFKFNPPSAPHFGGVWEIQIKAAKSHLHRIVGDQVLTFEELTTLFVQIESVLNSRPLCPISSDPNDLHALTPGHFLTLEPLTIVPGEDVADIKITRLNRWQLIQSFHQTFWLRWKNEYLHTLTQRAKWTNNSESLKNDSLVIIKDDCRSSLHWPLGRVVELHPGPDGIVRVASIRTAKDHIIKRPLVKLCPLPLEQC